MITLNLTNLDNSDIKYLVSKFPDGQQAVSLPVISGCYNGGDGRGPIYLNGQSITIKSRLNNFMDLELIVSATASLREIGVKDIHLYTPYFLGCRSDRKFSEGGNNYLKQVICPIINSLNFSSVTILDPHSDVPEACLNNFDKQSNTELVEWAIFNNLWEDHIKRTDIPLKGNKNFLNDCILISPDAGANKKIFKIAEDIGYQGDVITCSKSRDVNGKLSHIKVPLIPEHTIKDLIIIDDICDGGATFINIAKAVKSYKDIVVSKGGAWTGKLYLIVTHGIFSHQFNELQNYFDGIFCTNSYRDVTEIETSPYFLKQLNVF